ncbi:MAG: MarR family transcriptional regulator [Clostridia bacterium]|nr:MarR family transcriptional regulator [Clostridia bacterium]
MNKNICAEVRILSNLIRRKTLCGAEIEEMGKITGGHGYIIAFLSENSNKNVYQRDIEKHFKIRRSTVTATLHRMEKNGVITRVSDASDSRLKRIILTDKGLELFKNFKIKADAIENQISSVLSEEESKQFIELIKKLQKGAEG